MQIAIATTIIIKEEWMKISISSATTRQSIWRYIDLLYTSFRVKYSSQCEAFFFFFFFCNSIDEWLYKPAAQRYNKKKKQMYWAHIHLTKNNRLISRVQTDRGKWNWTLNEEEIEERNKNNTTWEIFGKVTMNECLAY